MSFPAPTALNGTNPSGLNVDLTWTAPPAQSAPELLLHFNGTNGQTTTVDSSPNNLTTTLANTNTTATPAALVTSLTSPVGDTAVLQCTQDSPSHSNRSICYTPVVTHGPIDLTNIQAWTIEGFIHLVDSGSFTQVFLHVGAQTNGSSGFNGVQLASAGGAGNIEIVVFGPTSGPGGIPAVSYISPGVWHHFAMVKRLDPGGSGFDQYQLFIDGVGAGWSTTLGGYLGPYTQWTGNFVLSGYWSDYYSSFTPSTPGAYWSEVRVSQSAVYQANFTPPTVPFPNSGTSPTGYDIYRNGPSVATTVGGPGYDDVVPVPGTYTYTVAAQTAGVDSSPQSSPFTITIGATLGTTPRFLNDEGIGGAYVNSKLTLVEYVYLPEREPFLEGATNLIINRYKQEPTDVRQRGVDYTYFAVPGELLQTVAVTGISAQGVPQANTTPLVTPLVVTGLIIDPVTQLKFAYTVSGGQNGVEYTVQFTTTTQIQTSTVEEIFSINILVEDSFP